MLETRRMLTTIFGGDAIEYTSFDFEELPETPEDFFPAFISVQGDPSTRVDLFGATFGGEISDLSGDIISNGVRQPTRGGLGGVIGIQPLAPDAGNFTSEFGGSQPYTVTDAINYPNGQPLRLAPQADALQFASLATNDNGQTFGLQRYDEDALGGPHLDLAIFNTDPTDFDPTGTGTSRVSGGAGFNPGFRGNVGDAIFVANLQQAFVNEANATADLNPQTLDPDADPLGFDDIGDIIASDFAPGNPNLLYVLTTVNTLRFDPEGDAENPFADADVPVFFTINVSNLNNPTVNYIASDFTGEGGEFSTATQAELTSFTIAPSAGDDTTSTFYLFGSFRQRINEGAGNEAVVTSTGLSALAGIGGQETVNFGAIEAVNIFQEAAEIQSLEYRPDNNLLYALTTAGEDQQLISFSRTIGQGALDNEAQLVGGTQASTAEGDERGNSLLSLTYDPTRFNPFLDDGDGLVQADEVGGFLAYDTEVDQLFEVDLRRRGVGGALSLYNIVVTNPTPETVITIQSNNTFDDRALQGFNGSPGPLAFYGDESVAELDDVGELYLGLKYTVEPMDGLPFAVVFNGLNPNALSEGTEPFNGPLYSGQVRPGFYSLGSIGEFHFGGVVTGNVRVEGSLGTLSAGAILTGDASGILNGSTSVSRGSLNTETLPNGRQVPVVDNFAVFGDVGRIVSATSIGDSQVEEATDVVVNDEPLSNAFVSGVDIAIGGRIGAIRAGGSIVGTIDVLGDVEPEGGFTAPTFFDSLNQDYVEFETQVPDDEDDRGVSFLSGDPVIEALYNDSFETYEPIGATSEGERRIFGLLNSSPENVADRDYVDYYGIGMLAGEEFVVQVETPGIGIGVFDPDGRRVASNYENNGRTQDLVATAPFRVRTETAGTYRIAVGFYSLPGLQDGPATDVDDNDDVRGSAAYTVNISEAGDIVAGGIVANERIYIDEVLGDSFQPKPFVPSLQVGTFDAIRIRKGDLGIIDARGDTILGFGTVRTGFGHMRSVAGSGVGRQVAADGIFDAVTLRAGFSIGRIEGTGVAGGAVGGDVFINTFGSTGIGNIPLVTEVAAGDDIQVVRGARDVYGNFIVGRGIGSIAAGRDFANEVLVLPDGARIFVNVDDINDDGFVDLLSVGGNIGLSTPDLTVIGGPAIDVGTNGNFRYIDLPEEGTLIRDSFFTSFPSNDFQEVPAGDAFSFTDDSGTRVRVTTDNGQIDPNFDPFSIDNDPTQDPPRVGQGQLEVLTYPVRSGGSILVSVRSTSSVGIETLDRGNRTSGEVGNIFLTGDNGRRVEFATDPIDDFNINPDFVPGVNFGLTRDPEVDLTDPDAEPVSIFDDVEVTLEGRNVDVWAINASGGGDGRLTEINNSSFGEILNTNLTSVGLLRGERIGIAEPRGFADLRPATLQAAGGTFPFDREPYLIAFEGSILEIEADTVGNVYAGLDLGLGVTEGTTPVINTDDALSGGEGDGISPIIAGNRIGEPRGVIGSIRADQYGGGRAEQQATGVGRDTPFRFEGIAGPIVAATDDTTEAEGEIRFVDIGEGIADDGNGSGSGGGLYAEAFILDVRGSDGANIYGDIIAGEINSIRLSGGSLLGADITQTATLRSMAGDEGSNSNLSLAREFDFRSRVLNEGIDTEQSPVFEIDLIEIDGGGIIGSDVSGADVDRVRVTNGFGIHRSTVAGSLSDGVLRSVVTDGLGIRNADIFAGLNIGSITAQGDFTPIDITQFDQSVRLSETDETFDPVTGQQINATNDLRYSIGLPEDVNERAIITADGVIENTIVTSSRDIGSYNASFSRSNSATLAPLVGFEDETVNIGSGDPDDPLFINRVSAGRTISLYDLDNTNGFSSVSGEIALADTSDTLENTLLRTSGRFEEAIIGGTLSDDAFLRAEGPDGSIGTVTAGTINGFVRADVSIDSIFIDGDLGGPGPLPDSLTNANANIRAGGDLQPNSPISRIVIGGDILAGAYIRATDEIDELTIGGDIEDGAIVQAEEIDNLTIGGANFGQIIRT